jgi:uncharacterized membrane protein
MIEIIPNWHPILVHFTIGLLASSVGFFLLATVLPVSQTLKSNWQVVAHWCLWLGMGITLFTVLAGYVAYNSVAHDTPSHAAMTEHRNWAFVTAAAFLFLTIWSIWLRLKKRIPGYWFLIFTLISGGLLASTGWHGGEAVYRYGLGVMSLPKVEENSDGSHASHSHGEGSTGASSGHIPDTTMTHHEDSSAHDHAGTKSKTDNNSAKESHENTPHTH